MTLTPATLRLDAQGRACGQGFIAAGQTCHKRGAFPKRAALAAGLTAGAIGGALVFKGSRNAILGAPAAIKRTAQRGVTEVVHRATAKPPSMRLSPKAFEDMRPPSKTQRLSEAAKTANRRAEKAIQKAAQLEVERAGAVGNAMYESGRATRASLRSGMRRHNLTVERLRRRYEPGYRRSPRGRSDNYIPLYAPTQIQPPLRSDACWEGYVQAGMKRKGKREVPNCVPASSGLSRAKWKCSGKTSRRSA